MAGEVDIFSKVAVVAATASAIASAFSAYWSYRNTQNSIDQAKLAGISTLGFRIQGGLGMEWHSVGNAPGAPTFPFAPSLEVTNFGPRAAKNVKISLAVEGGFANDFIVGTGPKDSSMPVEVRLFRVTKGVNELSLSYHDDHGEFPQWHRSVKLQSRFTDRVDFIAVDKTYSFEIPDGIKAEIATRLLVEHVFRHGDIRRPDGKPMSFGDPLILSLRAEWDYQEGGKSPAAEARWVISTNRVESRTGENAPFVDIISARTAEESKPEWRTLRFGANFARN